MTGNDEKIGLQRLNLGQCRRHVGQISRQLVIDDDLQAVFLDVLNNAGADVERKRIVLKRHSNFHIARLFAVLFGDFGRERD